jgi:hypothetical protein
MTNKLLKIVVIIVLISLELKASESLSGKNVEENNFNPDFNSLFFTFDYSTQTNTFGVINENAKQPNYAAGIGFFSKYNFDVSVQSVFTENADTSYTKTSAEVDFIIGYSLRPNENFTIYPSYTHIEYNKTTSPVLSAFRDIAQLNFYYDKDLYSGGLITSMLFGDRNMFYLSLQNAIGFYFDNFIAKNSLLSFQLEFDVNFSDKNYYNKLVYELWNAEELFFWVAEEFSYDAAYAILYGIRNYGLQATKERFYDVINERDKSVFGPSYNITSVNLMLPVYYSIGQFMFSFTTFLNIPTSSNSFYEQNTQLLFNAGIAYNLDF